MDEDYDDDYTSLADILDIDVYDINDEETTVGALLDNLNQEDKEKLRKRLNA